MKINEQTAMKRLQDTQAVRVMVRGGDEDVPIVAFKTAVANLLTPEEIEACKNPALILQKDPVVD